MSNCLGRLCTKLQSAKLHKGMGEMNKSTIVVIEPNEGTFSVLDLPSKPKRCLV